MTESLLGTAMMGLLVGALCGVIESWNRKVIFFIWVSAAVLILISLIVLVPSGYAEGFNWSIWNWVVFVISLIVGAIVLSIIVLKKNEKEGRNE